MPKVPSNSRHVFGDDLAKLRSCGLTAETVRENGLYTSNDSAELARILNCSRECQSCLGGLVIPYRGLDGKVNCFARVRPHIPRVRNGKRIKYEQPKGAPLRAYFPAASLPLIRDGETQILITEGEWKALALAQLGLAAIGIGGVDCWGKDGELIADLAAIDWTGRDVGIVFDYDPKPETRRNVASAMRRLAKALRAAGAKAVYNIDLPPGPDGGKQGVDDFLCAAGSDGASLFDALIERAEPVLSEPTVTNNVIKITPVSPPELGEAAYHGFVGRFLRAVAPYTEATDAGVLAHLLPAVGTLIGPTKYVWAGNRQPARLNCVVVGPTNAGRKGTSAAPVELAMEEVDRAFWSRQRANGLSSGEGLIAYVADQEEKDSDGKRVIVPTEKRLYVIEEEFSRVLAQIRRDGNILSQIIRSAYDNGNLATLTVNPRYATGAHISIVGHITPEELAERLDHIEMANGFGNRFLWFLVRSEKVMARTEPIPNELFMRFAVELRSLPPVASKEDCPVELDGGAQSLWAELYPQLREDRPGLAGAMVSRGSSMVLRVALIYAILDAPPTSHKPLAIRVEHLEAARAVWAYCEASAMTLFDSQTGDALCDKLLHLLGSGPMTKDDFNRHLSLKQKNCVGRALEKLKDLNLIRKSLLKHEGAGRPATVWERVPG
jgi:hypothetical protein